MIKNNYYNIFNFFKLAFEDIEEYLRDTWVPTYMSENPRLSKYKKYSDVVKNMPIEDYREPIDLTYQELNFNLFDARVDATESILNYLDDVKEVFMEEIDAFANDTWEAKVADAFLDIIVDLITYVNPNDVAIAFRNNNQLKNCLITNASIQKVFDKKDGSPKTINIPQGSFLPRICQTIVSEIDRYAPEIMSRELKNKLSLQEIMKLEGYKKLEYYVSDKFKAESAAKANQKFEIVFSTNPSDVLSMSTRSSWTSCQNLLQKSPEGHNKKAVWSAISPYVGVIYLTNKVDFLKRGEEMVARSLVTYLENEDPGKPPIIAMMKPYSNCDDDIIKKLFEESLRKHSPIKVISTTEKTDPALDEYFFPSESLTEEERPYFDTKVKVKPPRKQE